MPVIVRQLYLLLLRIAFLCCLPVRSFCVVSPASSLQSQRPPSGSASLRTGRYRSDTSEGVTGKLSEWTKKYAGRCLTLERSARATTASCSSVACACLAQQQRSSLFIIRSTGAELEANPETTYPIGRSSLLFDI